MKDDILCISSIDWDFVWQGHQEIMSRHAAQGHRVLFIENTGVRHPRFSDAGRIWHRWKNWRRGVSGVREEQPNLFVYSPLAIPLPHSRIISQINRWLILITVRRWMRAVGFARPVVWAFLPTRLTLNLLEAIDYRVLIYYCIDRFTASSAAAKRIAKTEEELLQRADLVFVTSKALEEHCAQHAAHVHRFPFGVDLSTFDATIPKVPEDVQEIQRPIIGYVGGIHQWVDQALLTTVAQRLPEYSFVLVGPAQTDIHALEAVANIHVMGQRSHEEIPQYVHAFNVGLIPYRLTEYTRHVFPTKLAEYMAVGKPVVSTPLPEIEIFNNEFGHLVHVGAGAQSFSEAVVSALQDTEDEHRDAQRRVAARANSWERRLEQMAVLIEDRIQSRQLQEKQDWRRVLTHVVRSARHRIVQGLCIGAIGWMVMFYTPLLWWVASPLKIAEVPQAADVIMVFAGGVGESGKAGQGYEERVQYAAQLYEQGLAARMIFSSGYVYTIQEVRVMRALAVELGVPSAAILLEENASGTYENVLLSIAMMQEHHLRSALVVSSPYHMRRVDLVWSKVAPAGYTSILAPVPRSRFFGQERAVLWRHWRAIGHEYLALLYYGLVGRI